MVNSNRTSRYGTKLTSLRSIQLNLSQIGVKNQRKFAPNAPTTMRMQSNFQAFKNFVFGLQKTSFFDWR